MLHFKLLFMACFVLIVYDFEYSKTHASYINKNNLFLNMLKTEDYSDISEGLRQVEGY